MGQFWFILTFLHHFISLGRGCQVWGSIPVSWPMVCEFMYWHYLHSAVWLDLSRIYIVTVSHLDILKLFWKDTQKYVNTCFQKCFGKNNLKITKRFCSSLSDVFSLIFRWQAQWQILNVPESFVCFFLNMQTPRLEIKEFRHTHNSLCSFKCLNYFKHKFKIQTPSVT